MKDKVIFKSLKPKYGLPCNNCGFCCETEICAIGVEAYKLANEKPKSPCKLLLETNGKKLCALVISESTYPKAERKITIALGINKGCCTRLSGE